MCLLFYSKFICFLQKLRREVDGQTPCDIHRPRAFVLDIACSAQTGICFGATGHSVRFELLNEQQYLAAVLRMMNTLCSSLIILLRFSEKQAAFNRCSLPNSIESSINPTTP